MTERNQIGRILVLEGSITREELENALERQSAERAWGNNPKLGEVCLAMSICTQSEIENALKVKSRAMLDRPSTTSKALQAFRDSRERVRTLTREIQNAGIHHI